MEKVEGTVQKIRNPMEEAIAVLVAKRTQSTCPFANIWAMALASSNSANQSS